VEQHAALRFARLQESSPDYVRPKETALSRLILVIYNIVWWMPLVLTLTKVFDYRTGSIAMLAVTLVRAIANLVRNNVLDVDQAQVFPLRAP
jgi:hypothetical protein